MHHCDRREPYDYRIFREIFLRAHDVKLLPVKPRFRRPHEWPGSADVIADKSRERLPDKQLGADVMRGCNQHERGSVRRIGLQFIGSRMRALHQGDLLPQVQLPYYVT